jgi:hypothetical protein
VPDNIKTVLFPEDKPKSLWRRFISKFTSYEHLSTRVAKLVGLPGPKEMGKADCDALPSRTFGCHEPGAYTWEDWHEEAKDKYPYRYFLAEVLAPWISRKWRWFSDAYYWVKCHTLKSYRFHLLDLRRPHPGNDYDHGWVDRCEVVFWAPFIALREYVEKEEPQSVADHYTPEDIESDPFLKAQKDQHDEVMAIYNWWMKGQNEEHEEETRLFKVYNGLKKGESVEAIEAARDAWLAQKDLIEKRQDEMWERLGKVRRTLWT